MRRNKTGVRFLAQASEVDSTIHELYLYDTIGEGWFGGVSAKDVVAACASMKDCTALNIYINSPGGDVFDAAAIFNVIKRMSATKTVYVDGLAASAASIIAMVGDKIVMAPNAMMMIHDPWGAVAGTAAEMRAFADSLDKVRGTLVDTYVSRTGQTAEKVSEMMGAETWMTADECLSMGFCDSIVGALEMDGEDEDGNPCNVDEQVGEDGEPCAGECVANMANRKASKIDAPFPLLNRYKKTPAPLREQASGARASIAMMRHAVLRMRQGIASDPGKK